MSEFVVRNCNPATDFPAIRENLGERFVEAQDGEQKLQEYVTRLPSSVLVCVDTANDQVVANICATDSSEPAFLAREGFSPKLGSDTRREACGVLMDATVQELRSRGHQTAQLLFDEEDRATAPWLEYGFINPKRISGYRRPLRTPSGRPLPDVELVDESIVARAYNPDTDYEALVEHLTAERRLTPLDTAERLRARIGRLSTSFAVVPDPRGEGKIIGSGHVPDGPIPLLSPHVIQTGSEMRAIDAALFRYGASVHQQTRGSEQVEYLARPGSTVGYGFSETWRLLSTTRLIG